MKRAVQEGKIRKSRGALFVAIVKRACAERGISLSLGQPVYVSRSQGSIHRAGDLAKSRLNSDIGSSPILIKRDS